MAVKQSSSGSFTAVREAPNREPGNALRRGAIVAPHG
jgi:hypothetical protein